MRKLLLILIVAVIAACGTPKPNRTGSGSNAMKTDAGKTSEEVTMIGTEFVPVTARNEFGIRTDLEGNWELESAPGGSIANTKKNPIPPIENKNDTTTKSETVNGVTTTNSTIQISKSQEARITPPQSSNPNMHVPAKPSLKFFGSNETFSGFTGCNKISGRYTQTGSNDLVLEKANPSTKMACIGDYDENAFVELLKRVNRFSSGNGKLQLMEGENILLVFIRK